MAKLPGVANTQTRLVAAEQQLFNPGQPCSHYVFVRSGCVRVELLASSGHHLVLYRIRDGQSCVMTTACLLGANHYFARAITETQVDLQLMEKAEFSKWLADCAEFREFVFNGFSERLAALMQRTAELATHTVDQRLVAVLLAQLDGTTDTVSLTHQQLAIETGTVREVVSRRLAAFEKRGLLIRLRGQVRIVDAVQLQRLLAD